MPHPSWDGGRPYGRRLPIPVLTLHPHIDLFVRLLGAAQGVWLHWLPRSGHWPKGRTLPHTEPDCHLCDAGEPPPRWQGYAPAVQWCASRPEAERWQPVVCPLNPETVFGVIGDREPRGLVLRVRWSHVEIIERHVEGDLPEPFDVRPVLEALWRMRDVAWNSRMPEHPACLPYQAEGNGQPKRRRKKGGA